MSLELSEKGIVRIVGENQMNIVEILIGGVRGEKQMNDEE